MPSSCSQAPKTPPEISKVPTETGVVLQVQRTHNRMVIEDVEDSCSSSPNSKAARLTPRDAAGTGSYTLLTYLESMRVLECLAI